MNTQPNASDQEVLSAFRLFTHDLWEALMSPPVDSHLPRLSDYPLSRTR
jgi:hypothetical protein